jgi:hypothetical protein
MLGLIAAKKAALSSAERLWTFRLDFSNAHIDSNNGTNSIHRLF